MRIDAHQHFWKYNPQEYSWIGEDMAVLAKDFLPKDFRPQLNSNGIDGTIAVQARQTIEETHWLLQLSNQYNFIKGVVGWVDLQDENLSDQLEQYSRHPKFVGVRHVIHDEKDDNFMLEKIFLNGIDLLSKYDLAYDILIFPKHLPVTIKFIEHFPQQRFVIDHLAKPFIKDQLLKPWKDHTHDLAEFPNVYCKVSGMVTEAEWAQWKPIDFYPYLDVVIDAFGPERVLFGSDWPVCRLAASYEQVINILEDYLDENNYSKTDKNAIWYENSFRFYKLTL